jgi:hypothetical protein
MPIINSATYLHINVQLSVLITLQYGPLWANFLNLTFCLCLQSVRTRNVDVQDYKFFSVGTVELPDGRVLHLIGMLGSWWIHHVSYVK